jgi:hypothetical protein
MDYKVKLTKCQNEHHHEGVFDTWTNWGKPQAKWAQGPTDQPNSMAGQLGLGLGWHISTSLFLARGIYRR